MTKNIWNFRYYKSFSKSRFRFRRCNLPLSSCCACRFYVAFRNLNIITESPFIFVYFLQEFRFVTWLLYHFIVWAVHIGCAVLFLSHKQYNYCVLYWISVPSPSRSANDMDTNQKAPISLYNCCNHFCTCIGFLFLTRVKNLFGEKSSEGYVIRQQNYNPVWRCCIE